MEVLLLEAGGDPVGSWSREKRRGSPGHNLESLEELSRVHAEPGG
jgi:hypothetical protein